MYAQAYNKMHANASILTRIVPMTDQKSLRPGVRLTEDGLKVLSPEYAHAFLGLVRAGERVTRLLDADLRRRHGISLRGFEVLLFLAAFSDDGTLRISDLTERAPLSQSRVSRLVGELADRGLVERSSSTGDARVVSVSITDAGLELFKKAQDDHLDLLFELFFSRLTPAEIAGMAKVADACLED